MKLYTYWRSSAAYRVRIGLNLKRLDYETNPVHLLRDGGEQLMAAYAAINPMKVVPALELDDGTVLGQSMAILEYLDEVHPESPLLPGGTLDRARIRSIAQLIVADIHPLNNLRVLTHLEKKQSFDADSKKQWMQHWITLGFDSLETLLASSNKTGVFCHGDQPTLADTCLIPQIYNARRFCVEMSNYPILSRIETACLKLEAFANAAPELQEDAPKACN